jgi:hypothetical protein
MELLLAVAIVAWGPFFGVKAYTKQNLIMVACVVVTELVFPQYRSPAVPALFVNSTAFSAAFNSSRVFDASAFQRMARRCGWSLPGFHARNFLAHVLPCVALYAWMLRDQQGYRDAVRAAMPWSGAFVGVITTAVHLAWALRTTGGLDLSPLYIEFEADVWKKMWIVAIATHVCVGMLL